MAHMQSRVGPMYAGGFHGWAQLVADGVKFAQKEDLVPAAADGPVFRLAPAVALIPYLVVLAVIPLTPDGGRGQDRPEPVLRAGRDEHRRGRLADGGLVEREQVLAARWSAGGGPAARRTSCRWCWPRSRPRWPPAASRSSASPPPGTPGGCCGSCPVSWCSSSRGWPSCSVRRSTCRWPTAEIIFGPYTEYTGIRFALFLLAEYAGIVVLAALTDRPVPRRMARPLGRPARLALDAGEDRPRRVRRDLGPGRVPAACVRTSCSGWHGSGWCRWPCSSSRITTVGVVLT